jgi:hypothetical protein
MFTNVLSVKLRESHAPLRRTTVFPSPLSPAMGAAEELDEALATGLTSVLAWVAEWKWGLR